ncbi:MAG: hypothetical protein AAGU17_10750 [Anaerolineaceae bacterium]
MKIHWRTLQEIIPDLYDRGITDERGVYHAAGVIGRYYCEPLSMVGMCPEICGCCTAQLEDMTTAIDPGNWYRHLVWRAKNARAEVKDLHATHEASVVSDTGNIFADFASQIAQ